MKKSIDEETLPGKKLIQKRTEKSLRPFKKQKTFCKRLYKKRDFC